MFGRCQIDEFMVRIPLRRKLFYLAAAGTVVLALAVVVVISLVYNAVFLPVAINKNLEMGVEIAAIENTHLGQAVAILERFSRRSGITNPLPGKLSVELASDLQVAPFFQGMSVFGPTGRMLAIEPVAPSLIGRSFLFRSYVRRSLATGKPFVSQAIRAKTGQYITVVAVPILVGGRVTGVLAGSIHLAQPGNYLHVVNTFEGTGMVLVLDRAGDVISAPPRSGLLGRTTEAVFALSASRLAQEVKASGRKKTFSFVWRDRTYLGQAISVPVAGWTVLIAQGKDELIVPLVDGILAILGVAVLGILLAGLVGEVFTDRYVVTPVLRAVRVAKDLAKGDFKSRAQIHAGRDELAHLVYAINIMADSIERLTAAQEEALMDTVTLLGRVVEVKDQGTEGHCERLEHLAARVGRRFGLSAENLRNLRFAAVLHDVGKVGVRGEILRKAGPLTEEEWAQIKRHPELGEKIISGASHMREIAKIVGQHQERFDGKGYPKGLRGSEISLEARIVAVVDSFDAMTSDRPYRRGLSWSEAIERLRQGEGTQFDPEVVGEFLLVLAEDEFTP